MPGQRILLADGDRLILSTLGQGLRDAGYQVSLAADGNTAVTHSAAIQPELAILDIRLPGISGLEVARLISQHKKIPFIILSASDDKEDIKLAAELGAMGYLIKPQDIVQIVPMIETVLARAAELSELHISSDPSRIVTARVISTAMGVIMERHKVPRDVAFDILRKYARSERRKIKEIAEEIAAASDALSAPRKFLP
jgi:two-component system, response regulator PdtaR